MKWSCMLLCFQHQDTKSNSQVWWLVCRRSMWVIGHKATLQKSPPWKAFLDHTVAQKCCFTVPDRSQNLLTASHQQLQQIGKGEGLDHTAWSMCRTGGKPSWSAVLVHVASFRPEVFDSTALRYQTGVIICWQLCASSCGKSARMRGMSHAVWSMHKAAGWTNVSYLASCYKLLHLKAAQGCYWAVAMTKRVAQVHVADQQQSAPMKCYSVEDRDLVLSHVYCVCIPYGIHAQTLAT